MISAVGPEGGSCPDCGKPSKRRHSRYFRHLQDLPGSCPVAWCSFTGVITVFAGLGRIDQAATAGSPTIGSSLKGAMVSSVIYLAR